MKKIISLLLCLFMVCSLCLGAVAQSEIKITFSPDKVQGKKGDIVLVDFSILEEKSEIGALEMQVAYDTQKLKLVPHPENSRGEYVVGGSVIQEMGSALYDFGEKVMLFCMASSKGMRISGDIFSMAFELLEDIPQESALVACNIQNILHYEESATYSVSYQNNWVGAVFRPNDPDAMVDNRVLFSLSTALDVEKGDHVAISFSLANSYTYIKEFAIQLFFDHTMLRLSDANSANAVFAPSKLAVEAGSIVFDEETNILRFSAIEGLKNRMDFGRFHFEVIGDVTQTNISPVTFEFVQDPVHGQDETFSYEANIENGFVKINPPSFIYEETENGLMLVKYQGKKTSVSIPNMVDGKFVTAIGANAFADCPDLQSLTITNYITRIEQGALAGPFGNKFTLTCGENSAAEGYAQENGINYRIHPGMADAVTATDVWALGDLNRDGYINAKDALLALRHAVKKEDFIPNRFVAADVNRDENINAMDALEMLKKSVGKPACF